MKDKTKKKNRKQKRKVNKLMLIGIGLILLVGLIVIVSALSDDEKATLHDELNNLTQYLNDNNHGWLVYHSTTKFINTDNLMLSNDNKMLACENGN